MLYFFDNNEKSLSIIDRSDIVELIYEEQINTARILHGTIKGAIPKDAFYAGHKLEKFGVDTRQLYLYRIETLNGYGTHSEFTAVEMGYEELERSDYIRDRRFYPGWVREALEVVVKDTNFYLFADDFERDKFFANFYYESRLQALKKIAEATGGELRIQTFALGDSFSRDLHFVKRIGTDKGRRFAHGNGLISVERHVDYSDLYTALIGRGSGIALEDEEGEETGGFSRKITFSEVMWSKASGDPLDKPYGSDLLIDPIATAKYGLLNSRYGLPQENRPRVRVAEFSDIEDPILLLDETYKELKKVSKPIVRYKAKIRDTKGVELGETVSIIAKEYDMAYKTRVTKRVVDLLLPDSPQVELEEVEVNQ